MNDCLICLDEGYYYEYNKKVPCTCNAGIAYKALLAAQQEESKDDMKTPESSNQQ